LRKKEKKVVGKERVVKDDIGARGMKIDLLYRFWKENCMYMLRNGHGKGRGCMGMKKEAKRIWAT